MLHTLRRILAYLVNDAKNAEDLPDLAPGAPPAWIVEAAKDDRQAEYAADVARKSYEIADGAVKSLQDKASSYATLLLALVPFALGATLLALPPAGSMQWARVVAFILMSAADLCLALAVVMAALACGLVLGGGVSLDRLGDLARTIAPDAPLKSAIRAAEAEALRFATLLSYASGVRVANDLFTARRLTVFAVLLAFVGFLVLAGSGGGLDIFRAPTPTP